MSTTFAIIKKCKCGETREEIEIARRTGQGHGKPVKIEWLSHFEKLQPGEMSVNLREVFPIDNTRQGVYNIGDLIKLYAEYKKGVKK